MIASKYHFNNVKLRNKLLILYILCVFIPIVFTNIVFYNVTTDNIKKQKMHDVELVLEQIRNEFIAVIDQGVGISSSFYSDAKLYDFFEEEYETTIDYIEAYDTYLREFNRYSPIFYSIQAISFYSDNPAVIYAGGVRPITERTREEEWYTTLNRVNHPLVVKMQPAQDVGLFSILRELDYYSDKNNTEKIIRIDINPITITQIFNNVTFQGNVYLVNENRTIEFSNDQDTPWDSEPIHFDALAMPEDTILLEERYLPHNFFQGWKIIGTISEREILEELHRSSRFIIIMASINFLLPSLIIILITRSLHTRIHRVLKYMKKMKKQNFETIEFAGDRDEIGELTNEFNKMSQTIKRLINEVYVANIQKKDLQLKEKQAQLSALQSQINPHFLFNALETIRMRSIIKGENETAKIIQNMAKIFRNSLTWGKDWVTIQEEMQLILCFLEIQKYRFGDKLEYVIDIDEKVEDCLIPKMSFLPFVENASIHGIEPQKEKGSIHLKIQLVGDKVVYILRDNGAGMENTQLANLYNSLIKEKSMGERVGIKNVYYRLQLYYKDDFEFTINSAPGEGTTVQISLPFEKK
ncbi:two-component system, sensor histidine kinase YesM [Evansella caseinilytica]|uniref:Two-component system, sensor histidine kinase YesM n=1 Tax=Evansella caseinilytica TaxID=1503961 RepID=A0A1H3INP7_9BACI|nr:sensor histidine kinase [Evansella caseinilytica]SDY28444.1 two-component system, sensor histidine kinase YesM [Evansella caseinilytica]